MAAERAKARDVAIAQVAAAVAEDGVAEANKAMHDCGVNWELHDGVDEIGVSIGVDQSLKPEEMPFVGPGIVIAASRAWNICKADWDDEIKAMFIKACVLVSERNLAGVTKAGRAEGEVIITTKAPKLRDYAAQKDVFKKVMIMSSDSKFAHPLLCMMTAMMISMYSMNHHIVSRDGKIIGYPGKIFNMYFAHLKVEPFVSAMHIVSHACSFKSWLNAAGYPGVIHGEYLLKADWPKMGNEFSMRAGIVPTGTAKLNVCWTVYQNIANEPASAVVPVPSDLAEMSAYMGAIAQAPLRFGIWSMYVTGQPQVKLPVPNDSTLRNMACAAYTILAGRSIAKAACLPKVTEVEKSSLFVAIQAQMFLIARAYRTGATLRPSVVDHAHPSLPAIEATFHDTRPDQIEQIVTSRLQSGIAKLRDEFAAFGKQSLTDKDTAYGKARATVAPVVHVAPVEEHKEELVASIAPANAGRNPAEDVDEDTGSSPSSSMS